MRTWQTLRGWVFRPVGATIIALYFALFGCAGRIGDRAALGVERGLEAGSGALDLYVDAEIERCRNPPRAPIERDACIAPAENVADVADEVLATMVVALRMYWIARSAGDQAGALQALHKLAQLARELPPEFFGGVPSMLRGL